MTDPTIDAAREFVGGSLDALRATVVGASMEALNRRPVGDDTNSIAVLVVHAVSSTRWWLSVALGAPLPERDRASEFVTEVASTHELLEVFDPVAADCRSLLATEAAFDPGVMREDPEGERVSAAWALLHAVEHLREHVAHAQLTRQVSDERGI